MVGKIVLTGISDFGQLYFRDQQRSAAPWEEMGAKGNPSTSSVLTNKVQSYRVWTQQAEQNPINKVHQQGKVMNQV